jgi:uncharacterized protein (DUF1501 family)
MCECNRRQFLGGTLGGIFAFAMIHKLDALFTQDRPKKCLVLWMNGGPSQIDTFDPKPGIKAIDTAVRGVRIGENLPKIARHMNKLSVIRSIQSPEGDHFRGQYFLHTGYPLVDGFLRPAAGSVISAETPDLKIPKFVTLGGRGFGPAFLGPTHAPFSIEDPQTALETIRTLERKRGRIRLMQDLGQEFNAKHEEALEARQGVVKKIEDLIATPFASALEATGETPFARNCKVAVRLLKLGVNFVEVQLDGWDTHNDNARMVAGRCAILDGPWASLMDELQSEGLLAETVVVWMGEFGRTPTLNAQGGRDHYPQVTCAVIGGGGIAGGRVVGDTGKTGERVEKEPVKVPDLFATLFKAFGMAPDKKFRTDFGGMATATDGGRVIDALIR